MREQSISRRRMLRLSAGAAALVTLGACAAAKEAAPNSTRKPLVAILVYWLVMLIVLVAAVSALQLDAASTVLNQILFYIPNIIVAVIVVAVGLYAANFVAAMVRTAVANAGIEQAEFVAAISRYAMILFTFAIALEQLGIGREIVTNGFLVLLGAASFAAALAVGLGARDVVARYLEELMKKREDRSS